MKAGREARKEKTMVQVGEHGKITIGESKNGTAPAAAPEEPAAPDTIQYLSSTEEDTLGGPGWTALQAALESLAEEKRNDPYRNSWQLKQAGGKGEPFYYDAEGWEKALQLTIAAGVEIYEQKWGHKGCDIQNVGLKVGDQWMVEKDGTWACERDGGKRKCNERGVEDTVCC